MTGITRAFRCQERWCSPLRGVLFLVVFSQLAPAFQIPRRLDIRSCPRGYEDPPLILISADGFRADYVEKGLTPTIEMLAKRGVSTPYVKPSYPSITFPNHYTIATGLMPPYHGIVSNQFYDPVFNSTFRVGRKEFFQKRFWGGEPIWKTVERQGKIAATYFWPGSETPENRPTYWLPYNESHEFNHRADVVLSWLDLPKRVRPSFLTLYFHQPDRQGHDFGPDSIQVEQALKEVDDTLAYFLKGLVRRNLLSCVNLILLSDHGMAKAGLERLLNVTDFIPQVSETTRYWNGVFPRFERLDGSQATTNKMVNDLSCQSPNFRVYRKEQSPVRWHLSPSRRIEDVVLDLNAGYQVDFDGKYFFKVDQGDHGYDNYFHVMNALFVAHGPAFKRGVEVESFQNIELYNLMCHLTGVTPAPNNGTLGALNTMLLNPPVYDDNILVDLPPIAGLPQDHEEFEERFEDRRCGKEDSYRLSWLFDLWEQEAKLPQALTQHLPYGSPQQGDKGLGVKILMHPDHVTAYSEVLRMPLWTSFELGYPDGSKPMDWIDDVRLDEETLNEPCTPIHYARGLHWEPLFHPTYTNSRNHYVIPYLSSNAVPVSRNLSWRWRGLRNLLMKWRDYYGSMNVVIGTAFDYNNDTLADDNFSDRSSEESEDHFHVPTHLFMVVTRCSGGGGLKCHADWLDAAAYIFPQHLEASNCMSNDEFAREFSAKVKDVELLSGLRFYPGLNFKQRTKLRVRMHSNVWGKEAWSNRIRSDLFGLKK